MTKQIYDLWEFCVEFIDEHFLDDDKIHSFLLTHVLKNFDALRKKHERYINYNKQYLEDCALDVEDSQQLRLNLEERLSLNKERNKINWYMLLLYFPDIEQDSRRKLIGYWKDEIKKLSNSKGNTEFIKKMGKFFKKKFKK